MILKMYSIYDKAAEAYMTPFFMHNDGMAIRAFQDNVNAKEPNNLSNHPDQFTLFSVGEFDDKTAVLQVKTPESLGNGLTYKVSKMDESAVKEILEAIEQLKTEIFE